VVRGLLSGMVVGGISAAAVLGTISLVVPLPDRPEAAQLAEAALPAAEPAETGEAAVAADETDAPDRIAAAEAPPSEPTEPEAEPADAGSAAEPEAEPADAGPATEPEAAPAVPDAAIVEVPAGSEFGRGRDDTQPVAPQAAEPAPDLAGAPAVTAPQAEAVPDLPEVETAAAPPVPSGPESPGSPAPETAPPAAPDADEPVTAPAAAAAPAAPEAPGTPEIAGTEPAALPEPDLPDTPPSVFAALPAAEPAPPMPEAAPAGSGITFRPVERGSPFEPRPGSLPQIDPEAGSAAEATRALSDPGAPPEVGALAPSMPAVEAAPEPGFGHADGVRVNRLPQLGAEAEAPAPAGEIFDGALGRYAADFEPPANSDLLGLVLIDPPAEAGWMDPAELAGFGLPVAVAVDPLAPGAAERAAALRAAGFEVGMLAASVPGGAMPADLAVNFTAWTEALPEAALIVEAPDTRFQSIRSLAQLVVGLAGDGGFGLVTHDIGLNTADQLAAAAGLPRAESFEILDTATQTEAAIRRTLDRAAFEAERNGRVLVAAAARPETLAAIKTWLVESRRTRLAPAPASAVLSAPAP